MWTLALLCWRPASKTGVSITVRWVLLPLLPLCAAVVSASSLLQGQVADLCLQGSLRQQPAWLTAAITEGGLSGCALGSTLSGQLHPPGGPKVAATMLLQYTSSVAWLNSCSCTVRWVYAPSRALCLAQIMTGQQQIPQETAGKAVGGSVHGTICSHTAELQWLCRSACRNVQWALDAGLPVFGAPGSCSGTAAGTWKRSGWGQSLKLTVKPRPSPTTDLTLKLKQSVQGAGRLASWHKDARPARTACEHRHLTRPTSQKEAGDCAVPGPATESSACDSAVQPGSSLECKTRLSLRPAACRSSLKYSHALRWGRTRPPLFETFAELGPSDLSSLPWHVQLRMPLSHQHELLLEHGSPSRGIWLSKVCLNKKSVGHGFNCHLKYGASGEHDQGNCSQHKHSVP